MQTEFKVPDFNPVTAPVDNPGQIKPVYSNNAACLMSPHDLRIVFHEITMNGPSDTPHVELRANVVMAPTQMKALADVLNKTIRNYELQFGEIACPLQQPTTK